MHKSKVTAFAIMAVFAMAAFVGVSIADETVAGDVAVTPDISIKFDVGGTVYTKAYPGDATNITLPSIADLGASVPAGMEFKGWTAVEDVAPVLATGSSVPADADSDNTYYASLDEIVYSATFMVDGVKISEDKDEANLYNTPIRFPTMPEKAGFNFVGWAVEGVVIEADVYKSPTPDVVKFTADVTYTAVFIEDYAVSFDIDGTVIAGGTVSDYSIPDVGGKTGYAFVGWAVAGAIVEDVDAFIADLDAPATLTATFAPIDCTVTLIGAETIVETVKYGSPAVQPKDPIKAGFDFVGWFVDDKAYDFTAPVTGDLTITAKFTEAVPVYSAVFVIGTNADGTDKTVAYPIGGIITEPMPEIPEGQKFAGWLVGTTVIDDPVAYLAGLKEIASDVRFVASYAEADPPAEPTGRDDPMTVTLWIVLGCIIGVAAILAVWKRAEIMTVIHEKTAKKEEKEGEE